MPLALTDGAVTSASHRAFAFCPPDRAAADDFVAVFIARVEIDLRQKFGASAHRPAPLRAPKIAYFFDPSRASKAVRDSMLIGFTKK